VRVRIVCGATPVWSIIGSRNLGDKVCNVGGDGAVGVVAREDMKPSKNLVTPANLVHFRRQKFREPARPADVALIKKIEIPEQGEGKTREN
jgi:hypothetical protein